MELEITFTCNQCAQDAHDYLRGKGGRWKTSAWKTLTEAMMHQQKHPDHQITAATEINL